MSVFLDEFVLEIVTAQLRECNKNSPIARQGYQNVTFSVVTVLNRRISSKSACRQAFGVSILESH